MNNGFPAELVKKYTRLNNIGGWLLFLIAGSVYWATIEPTASFWDCSEFIAIDYKLQIGHPPGAPFLQLIAHLISLLSFGDLHKIAPLINRVSATCSALTIMFLFWTITYFAKKLVQGKEELTEAKMYLILCAGLIGALAYTFTDSFWFSAIEGEVYAMSSCFTAMVFWCILKWERAEAHAERWLVLTFYLVGLSIGVHLLCLLTLPAVVFIYYFKKWPTGLKPGWVSTCLSFLGKNRRIQGAVIAGIVAVILLGSIQSWLIPGIVQLAFDSEIFFVNKMHLAFESGTLIYGISLFIIISLGLLITRIFRLPALNTAILAFAMLLIGYSSFFVLIVRSNANPPMNENCPSDAVKLHAYLGREQYGDWPLLYGQYYNAPLDAHTPYVDGEPIYAKDEKAKKYVVINDMKGEEVHYDSKFCTFFPRMWDGNEGHPQGYRNWGGIDFDSVEYAPLKGKPYKIAKPTFGDNLTFFARYQVNFMFFRYFFWNFCGRQNDIQGYDYADNLHGNCITGFSFLDGLFAPQDNVPQEQDDNKGNNPMYGLPLFLGLMGFVYQCLKDRTNALVISVLFFFTGLAIILYLNQTPYQPRERDYSYVGAFYAFAIWIGLGVIAMYEMIASVFKQSSEKKLIITATAICLIVPVIMAHAEWNDHDRSNRYTCRDFAINYLESCAPNAILFTNGDNDTFPLWYAQEVEGIRTDVRVCNLSLLASGWYIDQMKRQVYTSAPLPISMMHDKYEDGVRDYIPIYDNKRGEGYTDLKELMDFVESDSANDKAPSGSGKLLNYFPTNRFEIKVDKENLIKTGAVPANASDSILPALDWVMPGGYVLKNTLAVLDLLANNNWQRPVYFAVSTGSDAYMHLEPYLQLEGMAYRLVPLKNSVKDTRVATDIMYKNVMHKFKWGNMASGVYLDENIRGMANDLRIELCTLSQALVSENKYDSAERVLDVCVDSIPEKNCPYSSVMIMAEYAYYQIGKFDKANKLSKEIFRQTESKLAYYYSLFPMSRKYYKNEIEQMELVLQRLSYLSQIYKQTELSSDYAARLRLLNLPVVTP